MKKSIILTPKVAQKIQDEIYYNMPDAKKIKIVSQLFVLANTLKNSKTILKKDDSARITHNHQ